MQLTIVLLQLQMNRLSNAKHHDNLDQQNKVDAPLRSYLCHCSFTVL